MLVHLQLISRFDIAKKVPVHGETTFAALAASTGVDHGALCTILRHGIAYRIFKEPRPGVIAHSAASRQMVEDPRFASWIASNVDDMWPAAEKVVDALTKWPNAAEPNQTVCTHCRNGLVTDIQRVSHWQTKPIFLSTAC
jgi:hypothetical protein